MSSPATTASRSRPAPVLCLLGGICVWTVVSVGGDRPGRSGEPAAAIRQITTGSRHHCFGYIGHVRTIPCSESGRFIVALRTSFQDRMPRPGEAADIVLLDTKNGYDVRVDPAPC